MPRYTNEPPAVRVYTICDESRYLIVRNVPALGCGDELLKLFSSYGNLEECKPMDAEECDEFTDVYFVKFHLVSNARFAKRKLDEFVFLGNRLQVSYAPDFESLLDTKEKLEVRRREVLARLDSGRPRGSAVNSATTKFTNPSHSHYTLEQKNSLEKRNYADAALSSNPHVSQITRVSSDQDYFASESMNQTVHLVREKLDKIQSCCEHLEAGPVSKRSRVDNRRRI
ncbi:RNA-binding protein 48 [Cucurbita pepo subsp. pepo]|uniref:RNA-binding protein 48 n=1 Tax=Cucurbita pepo subsp. pepo TaxID=3664 RepID=UPI000C9D5BC7|nr:RNA-binding protein 48 [Cucurbita pepo subsp. pepo]